MLLENSQSLESFEVWLRCCLKLAEHNFWSGVLQTQLEGNKQLETVTGRLCQKLQPCLGFSGGAAGNSSNGGDSQVSLEILCWKLQQFLGISSTARNSQVEQLETTVMPGILKNLQEFSARTSSSVWESQAWPGLVMWNCWKLPRIPGCPLKSPPLLEFSAAIASGVNYQRRVFLMYMSRLCRDPCYPMATHPGVQPWVSGGMALLALWPLDFPKDLATFFFSFFFSLPWGGIVTLRQSGHFSAKIKQASPVWGHCDADILCLLYTAECLYFPYVDITSTIYLNS
jgi:hypothetical protein